MNENKPNPFQLKKELTLKITQKIGNYDYEIICEKGKDTLEINSYFESRLVFSEDMPISDTVSLVTFLEASIVEISKLNAS